MCQSIGNTPLFQSEGYRFLLSGTRNTSTSMESTGPWNDIKKSSSRNKYHKTAAQIALRWELQQDILPICKSLNPERMKQNKEIFDFSLSSEDCQKISELGDTLRTGPNPDSIDF